MSRRFIATIVAAAISVTALGNSPARADDGLAQALAALFGVAIVGAIINEQLEDAQKDKRVTRRTKHSTAKVWPQSRHAKPRPLPHRVRRKLLPGDCLRSFDTREGRARIFTAHCLEKNYKYNASLPRDCAVKFRTHQKKRAGYDARCLRHRGYQLARR